MDRCGSRRRERCTSCLPGYCNQRSYPRRVGPRCERCPHFYSECRRIGAQGRDRTTDTAIFSRMLYQLSYLGTARRGPGAPVYSQAGLPCPPRFAGGCAARGRVKRRPAGSGLLAPETAQNVLNQRLRRRPWRREWRRNSTASGSGRRRGSARNKTAARPPTAGLPQIGHGLALPEPGCFRGLAGIQPSEADRKTFAAEQRRSSHRAAGRRHCCRSRPS